MTYEEAYEIKSGYRTRDNMAVAILRRFSKAKGLNEYRFDDGTVVFANDREGADRKHETILSESVRDCKGERLEIGDTVLCEDGRVLCVMRDRVRTGGYWQYGDWYGVEIDGKEGQAAKAELVGEFVKIPVAVPSRYK